MNQTKTHRWYRYAATVLIVTLVVGWLLVKLGWIPALLSNEEFIVLECEALNRKTPMHIDATTDIVRIDPIPGKGMRFNYVLAKSVRDLATKEMVHEQLIPRYTEAYKTDPNLKYYRERGVILVYDFKHADGSVITEFEVNPRNF